MGYINCNSLRAGYNEAKRCGEALCQAYIEKKKLTCGENGEYHTFVVDGPIFDYKIDIKYDKSKIEENYALSIM